MEIDYTVQIWKEGEHCIAHAIPLDVASSGETVEAARIALDEAVRLFLSTAAEIDTLNEVLEEAGYRRDTDHHWRSPKWLAVEQRAASVGA